MIIHQIVSHKFIVLCLSILVALPFLIQLPEVKTVDNVDYFAIKNDPDILFYENLKSIFGNDEFFTIAFKKENLFTAEHLGLLKKLTNELAGIEGVREIKSLANVNDMVGEDNFFIVRNFLETIPEDSPSLEKLRTRAVGNSLYLKNIISLDGNTAAIVIYVHRKPDEPDFRKKIITQAETILGKYKDNIGTVHIAGWTFTNLALSQYLKKDIATFIPIAFLLITLSVFLFFGNIRLTLISVVNISLCVGCAIGLLPMLGMTLNTVTIIGPPVVMALALSDMAHIFSCLDGNLMKGYPNKEQAVAAVLRKLVIPCFLTTLTTAVGFFSLYLNDSPPIKEFAIITSAGIVFEFVFSFSFLPALMLLFDEKKIIRSIYRTKTGSSRMGLCLGLLSKFNHAYFRRITLAGLLVIGLSVWLSFQLKVESNLLEYFKPKSPLRISSGFVEKELGGIGTLDISFKADAEEAFKLPRNLLMIETLQQNINTIEGVDKTLSFVDFIKNMNHSFHNERPEFYRIPDSADLISQYLLLYDHNDLMNFINDSFDHARMSIRISKHSTRDQAVIIQKIHAFVETMDARGMDIRVSGQVLQEVNIIHALVKGQIYSLGTSVSLVLLIMFFTLRSVPLSLLSIFPNIFPIVVNFGIMGLFNIAINESTALISSLIMGIAVDDTIHFLMEFKRISGSADTGQAVTHTFHERGKGMILSSVILFIGFGVMSFSNFVPTMYFGLLTSLMIILALMGDLLLLPSAILVISTMTGIKLYKQRQGVL